MANANVGRLNKPAAAFATGLFSNLLNRQLQHIVLVKGGGSLTRLGSMQRRPPV